MGIFAIAVLLSAGSADATLCSNHQEADVCAQNNDGGCRCMWNDGSCQKSNDCGGMGTTDIDDSKHYEKCVLADGQTLVSHGWSGKDVGSNFCNTCSCEDGNLICTEMYCSTGDL